MPNSPVTDPQERGVTDAPEINGWKVPDRIWLVDLGSGDVEWSVSPAPDDEQCDDAVEFVRAALAKQPSPDLPSGGSVDGDEHLVTGRSESIAQGDHHDH